ncbi:coiled-coil domain-containing protein 87 isoform X2 [Rhinatrema bivittatum]|nr:coiled-coil domain-containing protein 87 isoform X2 [Rhinatrema bivittatum]XP_029455612.1 coiled-coil domain-containing protein 87 isoform X2 [Rhinatrema bivittatum]
MMASHKDHIVFSDQATFTQLKAQLLLDCSKFLNIFQVKRLLVEDLKTLQRRTRHTHPSVIPPLKKTLTQDPVFWRTQYDAGKHFHQEPFDSLFTMEQFIKLKSSNLLYKEQELTEILSEVEKVHLDLYRIDGLLPGKMKTDNIFRNLPCEAVRTPCPPQNLADSVIAQKSESQETTHLVKKSNSLPNLSRNDLLSDALEVNLPRSESSLVLHNITVHENIEESVAEDLKWLMQDFSIRSIKRNDETDIPPLIKILSYRKEHAAKLQKLEQALKDLDEKEKYENMGKELKSEVQTHLQPAKRILKMASKPVITASEVQFSDRKIIDSSTLKIYPPVHRGLLGKGLTPKDKQEYLGEKQAHFEPAVRTFKMPNKPLVKTADMQFSDRIFIDSPDFEKHPPLYNDLLEVDATAVKDLDRNLFLGSKLRKIYKEFIEDIPRDHLKLNKDLTVASSVFSMDLAKCMASSTLTKKSEERVINAELRDVGQNIKSSSLLKLPGISQKESIIPTQSQQSITSWQLWWKKTLKSDDYLKYAATQESDYLNVIFHFYESDEEEEKEQKTQEMERESDKIDDLKTKQEEYIPGVWNVGSSTLGSLEENFVFEDVYQKILTADEEYKLAQVHQTVLEKAKTIKDDTPKIKESMSDDEHQRRLERIWMDLHFPYCERFDMAIKYSSRKYQRQLNKILTDWERAIKYIQEREELLRKLEIFERTASNPNRLFQKGYNATLLARERESRKRKRLHALISNIEPELLKMLHRLKKEFNDTVTYKGRSYLEKMQWDKIEMLYWLQEERRETLMEPIVQREKMGLKLPPMNPPSSKCLDFFEQRLHSLM